MAISYRVTITEESGGTYVPVTTGTYSLRVSPFSSATYAGTHVASGSWNFGVVADGTYQLWNESGTPAQVASFGEIWIGDSALPYVGTTGNETVAGNKTFSGSTTFGAAINLSSKRIEAVADPDSADDAFPLSYGDTRYAMLTGNNAFTGDNTFAGASQFTTTSGDIPYVTAPTTTGLPTTTGHLTSKYYVDSAIASVSVNAFQESARKVRVFPDGTQVTDQVYTTIKTGVDSFATPTASNLCCVEIAGMGASAYISAETGSLKDYVTIKGVGHHIQMYLLDITATKVARLENMTVLMGEGSGNGARTYNGVTFENCIINYYNDVTLTACTVRNCLFLGSSTYAVTLEGATKVINSQFNNAVVESGTFTGITVNVVDSFTFTPPTDPTVPV